MSSLDQQTADRAPTPAPAPPAPTTRTTTPPPVRPGATAAPTGTSVAQTPDGAAPFAHLADGSSPALHPAVAAVMAGNASDTPEQHQARVAAALAQVQAENARMDEARRQEVMAAGDTVTAQAVVLGGSTMGTLAASTHPAEDVLGVSMLAQSQRPGGPATGPQATQPRTMDQWASYGDYAMGQSGAELGQFALQARAGGKTPGDATVEGVRGPDGKLVEDPNDPGFRGMAVQPAELQQDPDKFLRSNELALATAETRRQAEVPFIPGEPVKPIQVRPTEPTDKDSEEHKKWEEQMTTWPKGPDGKPVAAYVECKMLNPDGTPAVERVPKKDQDGNPVLENGVPVMEDKEVTKKICATETMDVCVGPGPGRKLSTGEFDVPADPAARAAAEAEAKRTRGSANPPQVTAEDKKDLEARGAMQTGEEYLGGRAKVQEGERVLVAGGGASGAWVCQSVQAAGAGQVDWTARHKLPKPPSTEEVVDPDTGEKKVKFTPFGEIENRIQQTAAALGGKAPTPEQEAQMQADGDKYREMVAAHHAELAQKAKDKVKDAEAALAAPSVTPDQQTKLEKALKDAQGALKRIEGDQDAFGGANLPRNEGTKGDKQTKDILRVVPITEGPDAGKTRVFFEDGSFETYDKVITSMGQDQNAPGGPVELMKDIPKLVPIMEGEPPMPVGLQSPGGEVRVMGASAWQVRDKLSAEDKEAYERAVRTRAKDEVSPDSTGVDWGFENMGDNPARANAALAAKRAPATDTATSDADAARAAATMAEAAPRRDEGTGPAS
jgi:hypothetical protein